mgnify:CR=1 FL=1
MFTLRTLKNPWQLEIEKSRPIKAAVRAKLIPIMCSQETSLVASGRASGVKTKPKSDVITNILFEVAERKKKKKRRSSI